MRFRINCIRIRKIWWMRVRIQVNRILIELISKHISYLWIRICIRNRDPRTQMNTDQTGSGSIHWLLPLPMTPREMEDDHLELSFVIETWNVAYRNTVTEWENGACYPNYGRKYSLTLSKLSTCFRVVLYAKIELAEKQKISRKTWPNIRPNGQQQPTRYPANFIHRP